MTNKLISVVICFRDWGVDRLAVAVEALSRSSLGANLDIVVSDYGSEDAEGVRKAVEAAGGRIVRTARSGPWSRSRALNAGVLKAKANFVITTDADMIFSRAAAEKLHEMLCEDESTVHLVQCRDLSETFDAENTRGADEAVLEQNSQFRPRWGMGGLIAFSRSDFDKIGGYDERMEIYGGEDIDFAQRLARSGLRLNWVDDLDVRIYHIWHPSTRAAVEKDPVQLAAQQKNRDIMLNDKSWLRNFNIGKRAEPAVSVLIATHNRADYLLESVNSTLAQTVEDLEIIILDDGSSDHTPDVLATIDDPRVRHYRQENKGVSFARNRLVEKANSSMIVVHDDDDIMLPWRVEAHLDAMRDDLAATYGGWVDFDNETGEMECFPGKEYSAGAFMYAGKVLSHGTSMFRTEVLKRYAYREHLKSGVDFNLIVRMANAGYKFQHTGQLHILRRMHGMNLTHTTQAHQKNAAIRTTTLLRQRHSPNQERTLRAEARSLANVDAEFQNELQEKIALYLPDHLSRRRALVQGPQATKDLLAKAFGKSRVLVGGGWIDDPNQVILNVTHAELAGLRRLLGANYTVSPLPAEYTDLKREATPSVSQIVQALIRGGNLDNGAMGAITILPVQKKVALSHRASADDDDEGAVISTRYWENDEGYFKVSVHELGEFEEATSLFEDENQGVTLVFLPQE